jgi:hypothetical protein
MLFRNPFGLPVFIFLAGLGIAGYYGLEWRNAPTWTNAEIEQSVDLNLAMDIERMGPHLRPTGAKLDRLRAQVRAEVEHEANKGLKTAQLRFSVGLIAIVVGLVQVVLMKLNKDSPTGK